MGDLETLRRRAVPAARGEVLTATITIAGEAMHVTLAGEIDVATSRFLCQLGGAVPRAGRPRVTIDLAHVTFIDLSGVREVAAVVARFTDGGAATRCVLPGGPCPEVISDLLVSALGAQGAEIAHP